MGGWASGVKLGDDVGGGNGDPNEFASSWIVIVDASINLTCSKHDQKYGRIPTTLWTARSHSGPRFAALCRDLTVLQLP